MTAEPPSDRPGAAASLRRWPLHLSVRFLPTSIGPIALWLVLVVSTLAARPPLASVDSLVLAQAWWQWSGGNPDLIEAFSRHPPLLAWLIGAGWWLFGTSELWARLVGPLFALGTILTAGPVARLLWPRRPQTLAMAPVLLVGFGGFAATLALTLPDLALAAFLLGAVAGLGLVLGRRPVFGWAVYGAALGLAILARGGAGLLYILPLLLILPWLERARRPRLRQWLAGAAGALGLAALLLVPWLAGLPDPLAALLADPSRYPGAPQPASERPLYWLLLLAPALLHPWAWWKPVWRAMRNQTRMPIDDGLRLTLVAMAVALLASLLTEGRSSYGLVPALAPMALVAARLLTVQANKPVDYHAALPTLPVLLAGLVFFLLNIVPVAHLDAVWRQFVSPSGLPIWLGGTGLISGLVLLGGAYIVGQATPRALIARMTQLALLPTLMVVSFNIEFAQSLRPFFDLSPLAERIHELQQSGRGVAVLGRYRGEYDFLGRLDQPVTVFASAGAALGWAAQNPDGVILSYFQGGVLRLPLRPLMLGAAGDNWAAFWPASDVVASSGAVLAQRF
jgi:4-amino-4-deoxy-L-arabinose transferase-like glycosyltransferase